MANKISEDTQVQLDLKTIGIRPVGCGAFCSIKLNFYTLNRKVCAAIIAYCEGMLQVEVDFLISRHAIIISRACLAPHLRLASDPYQLFEQLWPLPIS